MNVSLDELRQLAPKGDARILAALKPYLAAVLSTYEITTRLRFCHFIAQAAHETDGFKTLVEYGKAAYFDKRYGPQTAVGKRLGNTQDGDGARFRGRGIFQLSGRYNYGVFGKKIGEDLVNRPERASDPEISLKIACEYWRDRKMNALADRDDLLAITKKINGGTNGLKERAAFLDRAKAIWPHDFQFDTPVAAPVPASRPRAKAQAAEPEPEITPDEAPAIAMDSPPSLGLSKTLIGNVTSTLSGGGAGYTLSEVLQNPKAVWIIGILAGFLIVGGIAVLVVFRERIAKRLELGI